MLVEERARIGVVLGAAAAWFGHDDAVEDVVGDAEVGVPGGAVRARCGIHGGAAGLAGASASGDAGGGSRVIGPWIAEAVRCGAAGASACWLMGWGRGYSGGEGIKGWGCLGVAVNAAGAACPAESLLEFLAGWRFLVVTGGGFGHGRREARSAVEIWIDGRFLGL